MKDQSGVWNQSLLNIHFHDFEKNQIQNLPIIKEEWNFWREQGSSNNEAEQCMWKKLWKLNTIPRHKDFLWRILNDSVPVKSALNTKGILTDMFCLRCCTKMETLNHTFMECNFARKVWFGWNLTIKFPESSEYDFKDWLINLISTTNSETIIYATSITYNLWFSRNKFLFENTKVTEEEVIQHSSKTIQDYKKFSSINMAAEDMQHHKISTHQTRQSKGAWKKPSQNIYKINMDANLAQANTWGLGAVCRDENGEVLATATWCREGMKDPLAAEAFAMYTTMEFAAQCCFLDTIFESDNDKLIRVLNGKDRVPNLYSRNIIQGIQFRTSVLQTCG